MKKKPLRFAINQLIINKDTPFDINIFSSLKAEDLEAESIDYGENNQETLSIKRVTKNIIENRFITIQIKSGDKYPYSEKVVGIDLKERSNPRKASDIEYSEQLFVLIDIASQRIFISDQRKKNALALWLKNKLNKNVIIKSIINEEDFVNKITSIKEISFSAEPDLLSTTDEDILSHKLVEDILGFGAATAKIKFEYKNTSVDNCLLSKIKNLIKRKTDFKSLVVIGRSDGYLESTFNLTEVTSKIIIYVNIDRSGVIEKNNLFDLLIREIKAHGEIV